MVAGFNDPLRHDEPATTTAIASARSRRRSTSLRPTTTPRDPRITEYREFPDRSHWTIAEPGWEEVADFALDWAVANARQAVSV
jgi:hypothetical protein